jgi:hypothetical protein
MRHGMLPRILKTLHPRRGTFLFDLLLFLPGIALTGIVFYFRINCNSAAVVYYGSRFRVLLAFYQRCSA